MEISRVNQTSQVNVSTQATNYIGIGDNNTDTNVTVGVKTSTDNVATTANTTEALGTNTNDKNNSNNKIDNKELNKAIDKLNKFMEDDNVSVEYSVHPQFKDIMIKIVDKNTGDTITEVPPKKILDMVAKMCELAGIIFDKKA